MKTFLRRILPAAAILTALFAAPAALATPTISFVAPNSGALIPLPPAGSGITVTVNAAPTSGYAIASVQFEANGVSIGSVGGSSPFSITWFPPASGSYTLKAIVTDNSPTTTGTTPSSPTNSITNVVTITPPHFVSITSSVGATPVAQGSQVFLRASPLMSDSIVQKVEFLVGGVVIPIPTPTDPSRTAVTQAPYNAAAVLSAINGFTVGPRSVVARVTTSDGVVTLSSPVTINVADPLVGNSPPAISITVPSTVSVNGNVTVSATATDADGFIPSTAGAGVTFFADGDPITPVGTGETNPDLIAPYSITWKPTVAKSYSLRAQTIDNSNNIVLSAPVTVTAVTNLPTVNLTAPSTAVIGANVTLSATATPGSGATVTQVEFLVDDVVVATDTSAPYSVTWTAAGLGAHSVKARVTDSNGTTVTTSAQTLTVIAVPAPTVTLSAPASATVGTAINITATTTVGGSNTISGVQFFANGTAIGTATTSPYRISWTPTTAGTYSITAIVTDSANATGTSSAITVNVSSASGGAMGVTLSVAGSTAIPAGSTRAVTATVTGGGTIDRVELYYDGTLVGTDSSAPYNFLFTAPNTTGNHFLIARVIDAAGLEASSPALPITLTNAIGVAPLAAIVTPASGSFLGVNTATTITGTASDSDGSITSVQVYVNGSAAGLANNGIATLSGSTWSIAWTPAALGTASITAIASDNSGNAVAAPAVGVTVTDSSSPGITLSLSPGQLQNNIATLPSGATRNVLATVSPSTGRAIVRVEFFVDGTKVGEDTTAPYTFRYVAPPLAPDEQSHAYVLSARATDNAGAARDTLQAILVVSPIGQPPVVSLLTPTNNASVAPNTAVSLAATAVANGGTISSVQFYVNGSPALVNNGNPITSAPYVSTFTPPIPGSYTIDAIATDDRGNTTVSNAATITAAFNTPTIAITSPNPNATARATPNVPLTLTAQAAVQTGAGAAVLLVEFLLDDVQIGARTTPTNAALGTYSFAWTPTTAQLGQHRLTARVTDTNSQTATSAPVNVVVAATVGSPPNVSVSVQPVPSQGLQTLSQVNFIANSSSPTSGVTISSVEFFLNDVSIGSAAREQSTNLYRLAYDLSRLDLSNAPSTTDPNTGLTRYTPIPLYAIARDSNNNQTVSPTANLTINPSTSTPPSLQLLALSQTTITQGQQFLIGPIFNDSDGTVTQLQLYANGTLVSTTTNPQPNQVLTYTGNTAGRFNLYAVATDDTGNTVISTPAIVVNVTAVSAPVTTLTRPSDDSTTTTVGAPVFLEGTASNSDTTQVPTLTFIAAASGGARTTINGTRVGTTTTYRAIWTPTTPDVYSISTQANIGTTAQGTSAISRRVVVANVVGIAPSVTITTPTSSTTASTVNLIANATDSDGSVISVEFFLNRNSIGFAANDPSTNIWRITGSFAGISPGSVEVVALARDSAGNVAASSTNTITLTAASSIAPSISISPSTTNAAFNRQLQLTAQVSDPDGTVTSVQYFANGTSLGTTGNSGTNYLVNWTPTTSGTFNVYAIATDNTGNTTVAPTVPVVVRRNNPVLEDSAFILQTYQDIANTTTINPIVFANLDAALAAGTTTRADVVYGLINEPGFLPPVNLLATYYVLMGQWPTPQNYTSLLTTARGSLSNAVGSILSSNEYFAKYGVVPTVTLLNNPSSAIPAQVFLDRLWSNAGSSPSVSREVDLVRFMSNNVASPTVGRGYGPAGLNTAIAEFITLTNSTNTALFAKARAAALYYQLNRPTVAVTTDQIAARVTQLTQLSDTKAIIDALLKDSLYTYRYVTFLKNPTSLLVAPRSGALFSVEAIGSPPLSYQWLLNGAPIAGATNALLSLTNVDNTRVGTYTAVVTSATGVTSTSDPATLALSSTPTRLANISTRGVTTTGTSNVLIGGFVVTGTGNQTRQMLVRVIGPTLAGAPFNVQGVLADPRLAVFSGSNQILANDNWGTQTGGQAQVTAIQQAATRAGAFALAPNSADAVVLATLSPGVYTVQASGPTAGASGVVLIEVYDVTPGTSSGPKAANVSTRGFVGTGTNILIAGFVVDGAVSRRMLIRGAGPTLANLGVTGVLADPQITLINQSTGQVVKSNDNWSSGDDAAIIAQATTTAGAFSLANGSRDAAMLVMLAPGSYTVQLSGVNNGTGVGIVEVYDVDP